jgi:hypothetical protein
MSASSTRRVQAPDRRPSRGERARPGIVMTKDGPLICHSTILMHYNYGGIPPQRSLAIRQSEDPRRSSPRWRRMKRIISGSIASRRDCGSSGKARERTHSGRDGDPPAGRPGDNVTNGATVMGTTGVAPIGGTVSPRLREPGRRGARPKSTKRSHAYRGRRSCANQANHPAAIPQPPTVARARKSTKRSHAYRGRRDVTYRRNHTIAVLIPGSRESTKRSHAYRGRRDRGDRRVLLPRRENRSGAPA